MTEITAGVLACMVEELRSVGCDDRGARLQRRRHRVLHAYGEASQ